ncbi:MAG: HipA domain-containing protein [Microthrixaceae bacterium]|nr:HipA domain-containing protein [Microthrixaceae bacterium]
MAEKVLRCWWGDTHVADFVAKRPWDLRCRYTAEALERWPGNLPLLSCSLPLQARAQQASPFLRGLLPEGAHLQAMASLAGVATNDTYGLLARFGRETAGALEVVAGDDRPDRSSWSIEPYSDAQLAAEVADLGPGLGVRDDTELSLAGLQNKMLLVSTGRGWARPVGGHPSTHILKVDDDRFPGLVAAEAAALRLARRLGLGDLQPRLETIEGVDCLIVARYDRSVAVDGTIERLHQEDACQALGVMPDAHRGRGKYEANGGPTYAQVASLLRSFSADPTTELDRLVRTVTFTVIIGNADAHGKNLSLLSPEPGLPTLAPLYDTVPTVLWPKLRSRAAMSVAGATDFDRVDLDAVAREAEGWGVQPQLAREVAAETASRSLRAADDLGHEWLSELVTYRAGRLLA